MSRSSIIKFEKFAKFVTALATVIVMTGCASTHNNPADPFEGFNRAVFKFNDGVDRVALKPAATVYREVLPSFVQTGVGNFFGNLSDVWTSVNNFLQGNIESGLNDMMRVVVNSTFGFGGLLDIGSEAGLQKHKEDFGQTLGVWGFKSGPYVVLPLLGSSTVRDAIGMPVDFAGDPVSYAESTRARVAASVVRVIDLRASSLEASAMVEDAAIDRYEFIRDAYLQSRESKIHRNEPLERKDDKSSQNIPIETIENTVVESEVTASPVEVSGTLPVVSALESAAESAVAHPAVSSDVALK